MIIPLSDADMALAEALHRARNDLQAVASMLRLQARVTTNPAVRAALHDAEIRVVALSSLNTRLDAVADETKNAIDAAALLNGLATDLQATHFGHRPIAFEIRAESHRLAAGQGKMIGLILNELIINALKYAFPGGRSGKVLIAFHRRHNEYALSVADDGVGIDVTAPPHGTGLGRRLVQALAKQLGGLLEIGPGLPRGSTCIVKWPCPTVSP